MKLTVDSEALRSQDSRFRFFRRHDNDNGYDADDDDDDEYDHDDDGVEKKNTFDDGDYCFVLLTMVKIVMITIMTIAMMCFISVFV